LNTAEAIDLLEDAVPPRAGVWADFGAGEGTFTRALVARLGPDGRVVALDRERHAIAALERWSSRNAARVLPVLADFTAPLDLPRLAGAPLDGILCANALHFVADPESVLARCRSWLHPGGRLAVIEYEGREPSRWVPHPVSSARLGSLLAAAGFGAPAITATRPSAYGGSLYVAAADRLDSDRG